MNSSRWDRRQFIGHCATGSSAVAVLLTSSIETTADDKLQNDKPVVESGDENQAKKPPEAMKTPSQEVLLLALLTQHYPSEHFDESAMKGILGDLRGDLARGRILSEYPLMNSDEPSSDFRAYRGSE